MSYNDVINKLNNINTIKEDIRQSIINKGVNIDESEGMIDYPDAIRRIGDVADDNQYLLYGSDSPSFDFNSVTDSELPILCGQEGYVEFPDITNPYIESLHIEIGKFDDKFNEIDPTSSTHGTIYEKGTSTGSDFANCTNLSKVYINIHTHNSFRNNYLGAYQLFKGCNKLSEVYFGGWIPSISEVYINDNSLKAINWFVNNGEAIEWPTAGVLYVDYKYATQWMTVFSYYLGGQPYWFIPTNWVYKFYDFDKGVVVEDLDNYS